MTSSLVGSEMCIRDSRAVEWIQPRFFQSRTRLVTFRTADQLPEFVPVSYTHLTLPTICSV
eukprot:758587-Prorocentrum_lima.AAC.1